MALDRLLLEILRDPTDHGSLLYFEDRNLLFNPRTKTVYDVVDSIPVLLPTEGRQLDDEQASELERSTDDVIETGAPKS